MPSRELAAIEMPPEATALLDGMSILQQRFCIAMLGNINLTQAYLKASDSATRSTAATEAVRLLTYPHIASFLRLMRNLQVERGALSAQEKRLGLADIYRTPISDVIDLTTGEVNEDKAHLIQEITLTKRTVKGREDEMEIEVTKVKMLDKLKALDLDAKLGGDYLMDSKDANSPEGLNLDQMADSPGVVNALSENDRLLDNMIAAREARRQREAKQIQGEVVQ